MISIHQRGDFSKTTNFLKSAKKMNPIDILQRYGEYGVSALRNATPNRTGITANSWYYEISSDANSYTISFANSHVNRGINIAVILDVGHGTNNGGYVQGRNYIDPAIRPIFDQIANAAWKEVTDA